MYGNECWELDTLPPKELNDIVEPEIVGCIDDTSDFEYRRLEEIDGRARLHIVGKHFDDAHEWAVSCKDDKGDLEEDEIDDEDEFEDDDDEEEEEEEADEFDEDDE